VSASRASSTADPSLLRRRPRAFGELSSFAQLLLQSKSIQLSSVVAAEASLLLQPTLPPWQSAWY
jgi:hypothetical protein